MQLPKMGKAVWRTAVLAALLAVPSLVTTPAHAQTLVDPDGAGPLTGAVAVTNNWDVFQMTQPTLYGYGTLVDYISVNGSTNNPPPSPPIPFTARSAVYRNNQGTLDFYIQVSNNSTTSGIIHRVTLAPWLAQYTSEVGYRTTPFDNYTTGGTRQPVAAERDDSAATIAFNFPGIIPGLTTTDYGIFPGETSVILAIRSNATEWSPGQLNVINGGVGSVEGRVPLVPEPSSFAMVLPGLLPLGFAMLRRRKTAQQDEVEETEA